MIAADYVPGRSLAQMLEKAKQEQIPLGVDHSLSVVQGLAQALIQLHNKGLAHGILSPHSVWVSFEGATHILDAPFAAILGGLLAKCPVIEASIARYRRPDADPFRQDLFSLGAIFYELLTFEKLPAQDQIPAALSRATLKAAQENGPVPPEILELLKRLLMVSQPFENATGFGTELERVLYDGDYSPTTFNMAFFMHTLFREENDLDTQAVKADQAADFSAYVLADVPHGEAELAPSNPEDPQAGRHRRGGPTGDRGRLQHLERQAAQPDGCGAGGGQEGERRQGRRAPEAGPGPVAGGPEGPAARLPGEGGQGCPGPGGRPSAPWTSSRRMRKITSASATNC